MTKFTFKLNGVPVEFVTHADAQAAIAAAEKRGAERERERCKKLRDEAKAASKDRTLTALNREYWWGVYCELLLAIKEADDDAASE